MRDRVTGKPRGFGFVTFEDDDAAHRACADAHTLDGRTVSEEREREMGWQASWPPALLQAAVALRANAFCSPSPLRRPLF